MADASRGASVLRRLRCDVEALSVGPRNRAVPGSLERARDYCTQQPAQAGWTCRELEFRPRAGVRLSDAGNRLSHLTWHRGLRGTNLVASRQEPRGGDVLVVAHLDTVQRSPGADDNASGVAVALEVARRLGDAGNRTVIALADLEELGQLGSADLVRRLPRPAMVVCLESIGYFSLAPNSQRLPAGFSLLFPKMTQQVKARDRRGDFLVGVHRSNSRDFALTWARASNELGTPVVLLEDRRWNGAGQSVTRRTNPLLMDLDRSDHSPFWRAEIPAVMITGTATLRNRNYHRPTDTPESLDYHRMAATVAALVSTLGSRST